jgi:ABC-type enterochelin transport system permease subunit
VPNPTDERYRKPNSVDVLKQLVLQTLKLNRTMLDDYSSALSTLKFQTNTTEGEWLDLLGSVLLGLDQLYVVINMECLHSREGAG